jgi:hypothetical protein
MANSEPTFNNVTKDRPLLWGLPGHLSRDLFKGATSVRLSVDQILFQAGDAGDGCYRIDDGLLKVNMTRPTSKMKRFTRSNWKPHKRLQRPMTW